MLAMKLFTCFLQVLAGLAVHSQVTLPAGNSSTEVEVVVPFNDVWNRSFCRPIQKLVDIMDEYPDEVAHLFRPSCVLLSRCSGCCGDESLQCVPLKKANITMQVMKISPVVKQHSQVEMTFSQDVLCECRRKTKKPRKRSKTQTEEPYL
ncbi:placenta growth factor isoform X2 [Acomys russatus]|uniref:placenta growth factor isoform X1 n=1 Tax=Acomys russatus TaxID=60746 RepID=UPI0021E2F0B5|nr:placenta growth factor isoform X1 [Acomys russatus]XP_051005331.1 placenta growth factor isoform X2 [Acomys russatus]